MKTKPKVIVSRRSAVTGRKVSKAAAKANPRETVTERQARPIGKGFVILTPSGFVWLASCRPNRKECWAAFLKIASAFDRKQYVKAGYRSVPVNLFLRQR